MAYKISDTAIVIESDGKAILIADSLEYNNSFTVTTDVYDLATNYFINNFPAPNNQGENFGFISGGSGPANTIDRFPFSTDVDATDLIDLTQARQDVSGQSSKISGYTSGGGIPNFNTIDKFLFSSNINATDVGDLTLARYGSAGQSSADNGYASGGSETGPAINVIDKFPFSADTNATDVGDLTVARRYNSGQSSTTHGYTSGGGINGGPPYVSNTIDKFPFSTDTNATDVGDLTRDAFSAAGQSSTTHGYTSGGPGSNVIDKFPFASDANATDVGDITAARYNSAGQSSTENGYTSGGTPAPFSNAYDDIDKFPFSADANAAVVGSLSTKRQGVAGQQV